MWQQNQPTLFQTLMELLVNRKDLRAFTLMEPTRDNPITDPLTITHHNNQLFIYIIFFYPLWMTFILLCKKCKKTESWFIILFCNKTFTSKIWHFFHFRAKCFLVWKCQQNLGNDKCEQTWIFSFGEKSSCMGLGFLNPTSQLKCTDVWI